MIYFTADTHFGSKRTLELSKRPFKDTDEMDNYIIEQFNKVLTKDDILIHLGDFGNFVAKDGTTMLSKLGAGRNVFILGNYEQKEILEKAANPPFIFSGENMHDLIYYIKMGKSTDDIDLYDRDRLISVVNETESLIIDKYGFDFCVPQSTTMKHMIRDTNALFTEKEKKQIFELKYNLTVAHKPSDCISCKFTKNEEKSFALFGHIHGRQMIKKFGIDVGVDCHHFRPILLEDVKFYINAIEKFYDYDVFC